MFWILLLKLGLIGYSPAEVRVWMLPGTEPDCVGFNICVLSEHPMPSPAFPVHFVSAVRGKTEIRVRKKSLNDEQMLRYFSTGYFTMSTDYTLPPFLSAALGYPVLIIRAGKYPITSSAGQYIIHL